MHTKRCSHCKHDKDVSQFNKRNPKGYYSWCKRCVADQKNQRRRDPEYRLKTQESQRRCYANNASYRSNVLASKKAKNADGSLSKQRYKMALKRKYGLSTAQFDAMVDQQQGMCAICSNALECVDHCHVTGVVRGLLCNRCNLGIGMLDDNPVLLKQAAEYLLARLGVEYP